MSPLDTLTAAVVFLSSSVILLCLWYPDTFVGVKRRPDLPGPRGWPLVGNLFQIFPYRQDMVGHLDRMSTIYGPLFTFTMPLWGRNIVINRPEWLEYLSKHDTKFYGKGDAALAMFREFPGRQTAFASEGQKWIINRRIIRPIFSVVTLKTHTTNAMHEMVTITKSMLMAASEGGVLIDWNNLGGRIAFAIFCKTALSLDTDVLTADPGCLEKPDEFQEALRVLNQISASRLYNPFWKITEKFDGTWARFTQARARIFEFVDNIVKERLSQHQPAPEKDFLSTLLEDSHARQDPELVRDVLVSLLFASRDTNQNAMAWSLYELSQCPYWLDQMRTEATARLSDGMLIRYEDMHLYPVHLAVFYETLRLWPGAPKNARVALRDDELPPIPELGRPSIPIHKGDYLLWNDWTMMRDTNVWGPRAKLFDPGRHLDSLGNLIRPEPPRFHAFGSGPRLCPGAQLAAYEFLSLYAGILPFLDVDPVPNQKPQMADSLTSSMVGKYMVEVKIRDV